MMRRLFLICTLALVMVGCEDGVFEPVDPPAGGGTQELLLELTSPEPLTAGDPFTVRATVTEDGTPVPFIGVEFTAVNASSQEKFVSPSTVQTALVLGTADTTVSTAADDRSITITATASTSSDVLTVTLDPR
ncbi:MAG: hypothetical protein E2P00_05725 [Acidobacteria bacterium]|nr:MAG: hypothetical protein E2P00_05725 [Acidobacteriota bacterium]